MSVYCSIKGCNGEAEIIYANLSFCRAHIHEIENIPYFKIRKKKTQKKIIHILLSKKSYEELRELDKKLFGKTDKPTYDEYLKQEKIKPTMALFG